MCYIRQCTYALEISLGNSKNPYTACVRVCNNNYVIIPTRLMACLIFPKREKVSLSLSFSASFRVIVPSESSPLEALRFYSIRFLVWDEENNANVNDSRDSPAIILYRVFSKFLNVDPPGSEVEIYFHSFCRHKHPVCRNRQLPPSPSREPRKIDLAT